MNIWSLKIVIAIFYYCNEIRPPAPRHVEVAEAQDGVEARLGLHFGKNAACQAQGLAD